MNYGRLPLWMEQRRCIHNGPIGCTRFWNSILLTSCRLQFHFLRPLCIVLKVERREKTIPDKGVSFAVLTDRFFVPMTISRNSIFFLGTLNRLIRCFDLEFHVFRKKVNLCGRVWCENRFVALIFTWSLEIERICLLSIPSSWFIAHETCKSRLV